MIQQEVTGWGIACAAALAGLTYGQAKSIANRQGISADDRRLRPHTTHVRKLLSGLNVKTTVVEKPFRHWDPLPNCALLAIKWHREKKTWHRVVFFRDADGGYVMHPKKELKTNQRTDFRRMQPKGFIKV